jgi:AraC-like DNA-binding protein
MHGKTLLLLLLSAACSWVSAEPDDLKSCVHFMAPAQKSVITVPVCTLGVDSFCKPIEKVEIRARFCPQGSDTLLEKNIATITRYPFLKAWDLSSIPNQLAMGVGVLIIVNFADGDAYGLHREGIFLAHQAVSYIPEKQIPYDYQGLREFPPDTIHIVPVKHGTSGFAQMYWNEKAIAVRVTVIDRSFKASAAPKSLEQAGVEILIDPAKKRSPYPTDDIMRFVIPLAGKPHRITYQPLFKDERTYLLKQSVVRGAFDCSIEKKNREGFTVQFSIPSYLFGKSLPREMGYNIIVRTANRKASSLVNAANGYNHYSPLLWPSLTVQPKPLAKARWLILLVSFVAGFSLPLLVYFVFRVLTKDRPRILLIRRPEAEKRRFEKIKEVLDQHVTSSDLAAADIASRFSMTSRQLGTSIKKATGLSFLSYAMYLRTEIVCERLRSSHSSEASIAESCGFRNVKEMARWFRRFHHMTPLNFRKLQQVTQMK